MLADFYLDAQFPDGGIDFANYRTQLTLSRAARSRRTRQETDTISRMVYGFASAYLLTGEDKYLEAAEKGTEYLRDHMRFDRPQGRHRLLVPRHRRQGGHERKIFASEFGDDFDAIPAYEQIYALAGPIQTYRITGDPRIRADVDMTLNLFEKYFMDHGEGRLLLARRPGHPRPARPSRSTHNRARKNWNSVGDHAPAYLINLFLATGDQKHADMLTYTGDTITKYFPDYENSAVRPREVLRGLVARPDTAAGRRTAPSSGTT